LAIARADLNRLMGAPLDLRYEVQEPPLTASDALDAQGANADADAAVRPEVRIAAAAQALADDRRKAARAAWTPQVAAQAGYEWNGTGFSNRAAAWMFGGELRWSLSTGGAERAQMRASAAALTKARYELEAARSAVQVDALAARQQRAAARARIDVGQATVAAAQESQRIVRERFAAGLASVTDVLRASAAVLDAEVRRTAAVADSLAADAQLARALGRSGP
jgi:outer membrane protein TolC